MAYDYDWRERAEPDPPFTDEEIDEMLATEARFEWAKQALDTGYADEPEGAAP